MHYSSSFGSVDSLSVGQRVWFTNVSLDDGDLATNHVLRKPCDRYYFDHNVFIGT